MNVDELLERTLERHAADAPPADGLVERVEQRVRNHRRRGGLTVAGVVAAVAAVLFGALQFPTAVPFAGDVLNPGWRWESYRGIEVQVPSSWGYSTVPWDPCVKKKQQPSVARPGGGVIAFVYCGAFPPLAYRASYLDLAGHRDVGRRKADHGWVEETKKVGGVRLTVFSNDASLRWRIFASARVVRNEDSNGCPLGQRLAQAADNTGTGGVAALGPVTSISVCTYDVDGSLVRTVGLKASSRLEGADAEAVLAALRAAPLGTGPDEPGCERPMGAGEATVLLLRSQATTLPVVVRYEGCRGHGVVDSAVSREVTRELLDLVLTGAHPPTSCHRSMCPLMPRPK